MLETGSKTKSKAKVFLLGKMERSSVENGSRMSPRAAL